MPLNKQSGNNYSDITHSWNPIGGACQHLCQYCYVEDMKRHRPILKKRYSGKPFLVEKELETNLADKEFPNGCIIFVGNMCDMWAESVPGVLIKIVLAYCKKFPDNHYLFQSKNPERFIELDEYLPSKVELRTTIETNELYDACEAPSVWKRAVAMHRIIKPRSVTIEPIMKFDLKSLSLLIDYCSPMSVYIGADSKKKGLPEPTGEEVKALISRLEVKWAVHQKDNLKRLMKGVK